MNCQQCQHQNEAGSKFCVSCGNKLARFCKSCGSKVKEAAKFCTSCGHNLTQSVTKSNPVIKPKASVSGTSGTPERRQLTVMYCDLIGSTSISTRLDVEDFRQVILDYQNIASKVISRYGGHIAQYLGDGLVVYFGYPQGLEDAPSAAVRAALGLQEALSFANKQRAKEEKPQIDIRTGIHTGPVVIDYNLALGDTTSIAAGLESMADQNSILISAQTYLLVEGWFEVEDKGEHTLKGLSQMVGVYQVLRSTGARSRLEIARRKGLSPLVGRAAEINLLQRGWDQAKKGNGKVLLVSGEAGIGKSRLVDGIKQQIAEDRLAWMMEVSCQSHFQNTSFHPIIDFLERVVLEFSAVDTEETKLAKIEGFVLQSGLPDEQAVAVFADLLSVSVPVGRLSSDYDHLNQTVTGRKNRIMEAVLTALLDRASKQPVLLIVEDLHWADSSTLEWLELMIAQLPTHAILAIGTTRPGFQASWVGRSNTTMLTLQKLELERIEAICLHQTKGKKFPQELLDLIKEKTDGIPLFVEELTRMVIDSDILIEDKDSYRLSGDLSELKIPSTLKDSLISRLDQLGILKDLAQVGAVLGREFPFKLLLEVSGRSGSVLQNEVSQLVEAELWHLHGLSHKATVIFKHALLQDTAYDSLLESRKKLLHHRVASVLEQKFQDLIANKPELLAHHLTEAGEFKRAILQWEVAGAYSAARFSTLDTVHHLRKGLSLLSKVQDENFRIEKETDLLAVLTPIVQLSYGNSDVERQGERWLEAAKKTQKVTKIHDALIGQFTFLMFSTSYKKSEALGKDIIRLGKERHDDFMSGTGLFFNGILQSLLGNHRLTLQHYNQALELYDPVQHLHRGYYHTGNLKANIFTYGSTALHLMGKVDDALHQAEEGRKLVYLVKQPGSLYANAAFYSRLYLLRKEYDRIYEVAAPALKLANQNQDTFLVALLTYYIKTAEGLQGNEASADLALGIMTELYQVYKAFRVAFLIFLAEAYSKLGNYEKGLQIVASMEQHVENTQEGLCLPEVYRIKGDLLAKVTGDKEQSEECYRNAISIAQEQEDLWHEMLATKSLAKLMLLKGKKKLAKEMLSAINQRFLQGRDCFDLKELDKLLADS